MIEEKHIELLCDQVLNVLRERIAGKTVVGVVGHPTLDDTDVYHHIFPLLEDMPHIVLLTNVLYPKWASGIDPVRSWQRIEHLMESAAKENSLILESEIRNGIAKTALLKFVDAWVFDGLGGFYDLGIFTGILSQIERLRKHKGLVPILCLSENTFGVLNNYPLQEAWVKMVQIMSPSSFQNFLDIIESMRRDNS